MPLPKAYRLLLIAFFFLPFCLQAQPNYPPNVAAVLQKAGNNRKELEQAITYFAKKGDSLQLQAAYFLIGNMDIHHSANYYWADSLGKRVAYNELAYPSFDSSIRAFEAIKKTTPKIHPVAFSYRDIDSITAQFLITHIQSSFAAWRHSIDKNIPFANFCEYILPYRVSVEPLQNWRQAYEAKYAAVPDSFTNAQNATVYLANDIKTWYTNTYNTENRNEPLPRLGALQLLHRKKGACEDLASLAVFTLRSQGIASAVNVVPFWATSFGLHYVNTCFDSAMQPISFDASSAGLRVAYRFAREPGKVIRLTYSKQAGALANWERQENIPSGFLRSYNYVDVTPEFWESQTVTTPIFHTPVPHTTAYACVFNSLGWRPIWWGKVQKDSTSFTNMSKGVVYLPMYCTNGKLQPAGYPVAVGYHHVAVLQPDTAHTHTIRLQQQDRYLKFHPGKKYTLYVWNNRWQPLGNQLATDSTTEMVFEHIPKNALLLFPPEDSQGKERPFMITDEGERVWW